MFAAPRPAVLPAELPPQCCILVDAEEDFDWQRPVQGVAHDVGCMRHLSDLHAILGAYRAVPTYLLTYPVLQDAAIMAALRGRVARGQCAVGVQLHTWVTPPFGEAPDVRNSFGSNLLPEHEEKKLLALMGLFRDRFGEPPKVFRAGRYGLGRHMAALLEQHGFLVDASLAPRTSFGDEGGPDFSAHDFRPFWFGRSGKLLELPLCRSIVGWGGGVAARAYRRLAAGQPPRALLPGLLAWSRCAERITLSPEGNDAVAAARLVDALLARGQRVLALSLHSSSLVAGRNPYVRSRAELHAFYDALSAILDMLAGRHGVQFAGALDLPGMLAPDRPAPRPAAPALAVSANA